MVISRQWIVQKEEDEETQGEYGVIEGWQYLPSLAAVFYLRNSEQQVDVFVPYSSSNYNNYYYYFGH